MKKPFNPILGETYEARIGNYKVVAEQISHHPPITSYYMWNKHSERFKVYGYVEYKSTIGFNNTVNHGMGPMVVEFEGGHKIELRAPKT